MNTLFLQALQEHGPQHFQGMRDWDEQKNKLLGLYGYSLSDDLTNKFTFTYDTNGKPSLRVLDSSIKKISAGGVAPSRGNEPAVETETAPQPQELRRLGVVLDAKGALYPFVNFELVAGLTDEEGSSFIESIEHLDLGQYVNAMRFKEDDRELLPIIRKFSSEEVLKYIRKTLPFGDFYFDQEQVLRDLPADEVREQVWEFLLPKYKRLLERCDGRALCYMKGPGKPVSSTNLIPIGFSSKPATPYLTVWKDESAATYQVQLEWEIEGFNVAREEVRLLNAGLIFYAEQVYALPSTTAVTLVERLQPDGALTIPEKEWHSFLTNQLMPWSQMVRVDFSPALTEHEVGLKPLLRLYLQERDQMLVLVPAFVYNGAEIRWGHFGNVVVPLAGKVRVVERNEEAEDEFIHLLRNLHTDIQTNSKDNFLYLPSSAVLANNWFFRFTDMLRENNVQIFGFEGLKNLRINTNRPETQIRVSSGIDWFDASVEISYGDQKVSINEVKRALAQRQNYVRLDDGTLGLLPEEWLKKYGLLVKMGETKGNKLRLKKFHFGVLDELLAAVDEEKVQQELEERKERLSGIIDNDFSGVATPVELKAELRPYQVSGFQWLVFLREAGWGGILADDMGLGKTVQTLTFFQYIKNIAPESKFLVVCPTTLMYNWEAEIRKFTPTLRHLIHHGPKRTAHHGPLTAVDIVITTYGTMRSDIKMLRECEFEYAVLDESQAIKNPQSQVAKASLLLNAAHRLALSGTPVQNNTFDLYSQMNFLNPGMLGSREFFMNEFATPIDKFQEDEVKQQLRKLTYPFMLRRTKEQVAKDLPPKVETILYCEMGNEQRRIYDAYRNNYKEQILGIIDERGIERSHMHILQGLTKLRQICDSPAILNEAEKFGNHSIKLDELTREIEENVGHHKALVFSQFLGMLGLIRAQLEKAGIPYAYFDGSSTATERERAIQAFQKDDDCRVFLISLKAGGIGLNLTAADYVYIVDPWWNPAVEQQAIDRTHRIGQTKNIFAYRLICKDSIEEKMLQLQDRKRALASELVTDDSAFLKRLTREDIDFLLS